jgi:putative regulatory protein, FmdB family
MPTYEFRCPKGHEFEKFYRSIGTAPAEVHCPECGALAERQLSTGAGLVFKGSGFYITDYGKDGKKDQRQSPGKVSAGSADSGSNKNDSGSSASTDSAGGGSSEAKPASAAETKSATASAESKPPRPLPLPPSQKTRNEFR